MMVFPFLCFPARRRLRVFDVWISRRRVGFGTKAPGEALLRKCINPLRYFHPEAAKYRGLSEGDAVSAETYTGDMMLFASHPRCGQPGFAASSEIPSHGSETAIAFGACHFFGCASGLLLSTPNPLRWASALFTRVSRENHTVVFPQPPSEAQLPSSGRGVCVRNAFWRDPRFSKITKRGLVISHEIGYTVCRVK